MVRDLSSYGVRGQNRFTPRPTDFVSDLGAQTSKNESKATLRSTPKNRSEKRAQRAQQSRPGPPNPLQIEPKMAVKWKSPIGGTHFEEVLGANMAPTPPSLGPRWVPDAIQNLLNIDAKN